MDPVPALGAHTDAILNELGFDSTTIDQWHDEGMV
jgi:crotonobetainyl-CoA:carnitine CoA-transferase CaiB-like acyl-CoA transferase